MSVQPSTDLWTPEPSFGDRLRMIRRHMKLSQAEFADLIGESRKNIGTWESDYALPRYLVAVCKKVELATRVPSHWLLGLAQASESLPPSAASLPPQDGSITPTRTPVSSADVIPFPQVRRPPDVGADRGHTGADVAYMAARRTGELRAAN